VRSLSLSAGSGTCRIALGESIGNLRSYCGEGKAVAITDANVRKHHGERLGGMDIIEIGLGEENKTLSTIEMIYERFLELGLDRSAFVVGVGGGIVCDVAGFAASTYLRGLRFGFVPTTLLAQVDASVGGKNGVNFKGYKNLVGIIRQPGFCLCDFELLRTLPEREMRCGFAEIVKSAAIGDAELFSFLEGSWEKALSLNRTAIEKVVHDSLQVKISAVSSDETEKGQRMKLNFGHTLGHAIEKAAGLPHGEAVSIGMVAAAKLSVSRKTLQESEAARLTALLGSIGLPVSLDAEREKILDAMLKDKKRESDFSRMVLLEGIGKAYVSRVSREELEGVMDDMS
jgi:3-dehydroquinate synthase